MKEQLSNAVERATAATEALDAARASAAGIETVNAKHLNALELQVSTLATIAI